MMPAAAISSRDVVLYEEGLDSGILREAMEAVAEASMLIVGGTSLVVYPAAGLIDLYHGRKLVLINRDETPADAGRISFIHRKHRGDTVPDRGPLTRKE